MKGIISIIADFCGIVSLILSVLTFINTFRIKKTLQTHIEESDYKQEIDNSIITLEAFEKLFLEEYQHLNNSNVTGLQIEISNIEIAYEEILPRTLIKDLQSLTSYLEASFTSTPPYSQRTCHECAKKLSKIINLLKKKKRMIP